MKLACVAVGLAVLSGCASITASRTETLAVNASPEGSEVLVNGVPWGRAPAQVEVPRDRPTLVEVRAPGYELRRCPTEHMPGAGYVVADVLLCAFLFPIGCVSFIDAGGAWNQLATPYCTMNLPPLMAPPPPPAMPAWEPVAPPVPPPPPRSDD